MKFLFTLMAVMAVVFLSSCKPDRVVPNPSSTDPVITSFSPSGGKPGDTITITGTNFSPSIQGNTVTFKDSSAAIISATATTLKAIVPAGAATGRIAATVSGKTAVSANDFTVTNQPAPVITSFAPASGMVGDTVTITGTGFSTVTTQNTVKFTNNIAATVVSASATQLKVKVPSDAATGRISVTEGTLTGTSLTDFTLLAVNITSFAPALGLEGDTVIINGTGFSTTAAQDIVKFTSNTTATVFSATATQLKMKVPAGAATGAISLTIGAATVSTTSFEVLQDIPRSGLVAFYPYSGNTVDASGNGNDLSIVGTYAPVADRFGVSGKAYFFNGGNSYSYTADPGKAQAPQPLSVAVWVKYDSLISSGIIAKYSYPPALGYIMGVSPDGSGGGMIALNIDGFTATSSAGVLPMNTGGQWILIGMVFNGSAIQFYKNGSLVTTIVHTGTVTATTSGSVRIGLSGDGGTGLAAFKCSIDDATIYNRALNATEMMQLYTQTVSKK